jgi:hypothetical protein
VGQPVRCQKATLPDRIIAREQGRKKFRLKHPDRRSVVADAPRTVIGFIFLYNNTGVERSRALR